METGLSKKEMESMLKALAVWNEGELMFHEGYLKYAGEAQMEVVREQDVIGVRVKGIGLERQ
jgi:hypothetical protein